MLFSPRGSYQVRAMVNGNSLDQCSIIRTDDRIHPYFAASVDNDPDLIGLLVYLENSWGEIVGDKVLYVLELFSGEIAELWDTEEETGTAIIEEAGAEAEEDDGAGLPRDIPMSRENWSFFNARPVVSKPGVVVEVRSLDQGIPQFPLPENLEIGPYSLVFEALGRNTMLHRTETDIFYLGTIEFSLKDISMHLPMVSGTRLIPPGTTILLEANLDFDRRLDPYIVWHSGRNIISEGQVSEGAGSILWRTPERAGFHALRAEVFPFRLGSSISGFSREITMPISSPAAAPGMGYFFNDEHSARSSLAQGTIFPEQASLIAAALAENPDDETDAPAEPPVLLNWYQFAGSFSDATAQFNDWRALAPASERRPLWAVAGNSYGLATGPEDIFLLPPVAFFGNADEQGGGIFLFHIKSLTEGTIFSAFLPFRGSETDGAHIDVLRQGDTIILRLSTMETSAEMTIYLHATESQAFIPAAVEFFTRPSASFGGGYRLEAKLSVGERNPQSMAGFIRMRAALAGNGRVTLGGGPMPGTTEDIPEEPVDAADSILEDINFELAITAEATAETETRGLTNTINTIWDELAVLYSSLPILAEELFTIFPEAENPPEEAARRAADADADPAAMQAEPAPEPMTGQTDPESGLVPADNAPTDLATRTEPEAQDGESPVSLDTEAEDTEFDETTLQAETLGVDTETGSIVREYETI